jgi:hypothetical protein
LMGKADYPFGHAHEFFHFWSYIHETSVHNVRIDSNSGTP